uniref:Bromo domain-containing protein n=3 Tax=Oryza TaxID=4527 RepID=A0A0D3GVY8_9ORYZ
MGKTQKFSKGHPLGFVPDYRHGVETVGESKGCIGSPERIVSGSSCAVPKRKCGILKTEDGGELPGFNVPRDVFMLPRMSPSDKKDLEMRLRKELEQVKALQSRLFSRPAAVSMNGGAASASGDVVAKRNDAKLKRSNSVQSGRGVPPSAATPVVRSANYAEAFKQCGNLLKNLFKHQWAGPFLAPVDVVQLNIPDYFDIIKKPMDLGTIEKKLNAGMYSTPWDFAADVRLTFDNAVTYNPVGNDVNLMGKTLKCIFETRWKFIEKKLPSLDDKFSVRREPSQKGAVKKDTIEKDYPSEKKHSTKGVHKKDMFKKEDASTKPALQPKKRKASPLVQGSLEIPVVEADKVIDDAQVVQPSKVIDDAQVVQASKVIDDAQVVQAFKVIDDAQVVQASKEIMTDRQKYELSVRLQSYGGLIPNHVVDFIRSHLPDDNEGDEDELELDMNVLSDSTLFELQKLLDDYDRVNQSGNPTKDEHREVEFESEYGLSNSSMHHEEGNELVEEDVDIGGNDLPPLTYPPAVFESETAERSSKHSTSSSSSSDSESSSSDSDSSSSSGSDLDVNVPPSTSGAKDNTQSAVRLDQENDPLSSTNLPQQSSDPVPISAEDEGENVSEKQVPPAKQYRAAVLLNRFADTIFKAREKTLDQVAKKDPEKLQHDMEELERLRREERARIQAEAKAAEDARKRAEAAAAAEAAAEAKRQREREREAARKALQQMEKTVDINEGNLFLKDLEMLGTVTSGEQFPSLVGETSPTHTPEGLGFQLGSNPLEQLGLYMKNDDEEDEEGESADEPTIDVEEGEID